MNGPNSQRIRAVALRGSLRSRLRVTAKATNPVLPVRDLVSKTGAHFARRLPILASPAGLTTQVGFIRLAHERNPNSGEPEFGGPSPSQERFAKKMDCRVKPGNDGGAMSSSRPRPETGTCRRCAPSRRPRLAPPMETRAAARRGRSRSFRRAACRPPADPF